MTGGMIHEHDAFADLTPRELRAQKRQRTEDQPERRNADIALPPDQSIGKVKFDYPTPRTNSRKRVPTDVKTPVTHDFH
jgi:hypothetical protein